MHSFQEEAGIKLWEMLVRTAQLWETVKAGDDCIVSRMSGVSETGGLSVKTMQFSVEDKRRSVGGLHRKTMQFSGIVQGQATEECPSFAGSAGRKARQLLCGFGDEYNPGSQLKLYVPVDQREA